MSGTDASDHDAARAATESDVHAPGVPGDVPPVSGARLARYAEAIWEVQSEAARETTLPEDFAHEARAVVPVADAEQAELKAEVERWVEKANEAGKAYADANTKHHEELDRANRLEGMCERLAEQAVEYQDAQRRAESALTEAREQLSRLREAVEGLADEWERQAGLMRHPDATRARAEDLRAVLAESIAPVAAEEGGEQEAGEAACEHCEVRRLVPDAIWACVACGIEFDSPPFEDGHPAPSGSDEQGNRPATPDANGVHDTKGGE